MSHWIKNRCHNSAGEEGWCQTWDSMCVLSSVFDKNKVACIWSTEKSTCFLISFGLQHNRIIFKAVSHRIKKKKIKQLKTKQTLRSLSLFCFSVLSSWTRARFENDGKGFASLVTIQSMCNIAIIRQNPDLISSNFRYSHTHYVHSAHGNDRNSQHIFYVKHIVMADLISKKINNRR